MPTDVLVLNQGVHGLPPQDYAAAIEARLPDATVTFAPTTDAAVDALGEATVLTGTAPPAALFDHDHALALFACLYAGTDHLDRDRLAAEGVAVTSASGVHGPNVAEHAIGALLMLVREHHEGLRRARRQEWRSYLPDELYGLTVGVVGLGDIGTAVAERLQPFGVDLVGVRHSPEKGGPVDEVVGYDAVGSVVPRLDALVLCCPLTDQTRGLVDADVLGALPPTAILVNVARGPVVDTDALVTALQRNDVGGAALDVTDPEPLPEDHPLWTFENCLVTPHNAGGTPKYYERRADILAENVERLEAGTDEFRNQVA